MRRSKWTSALQRDESGLRFWRRVVVVIVISIGLIGAATITSAETGEQPQVFPLDESPYGNTYGEWSARWWQWLTAIPGHESELRYHRRQLCGGTSRAGVVPGGDIF